MNLARVLMHAVVVRRELLSSRHPSNIPPFCKIGGQNRKIQCALINQGFSQKATSKTLKILTFLCLFSSPERRSIRRCTEFHLKLKIRWWRHRIGSTPITGTKKAIRLVFASRIAFLCLVVCCVGLRQAALNNVVFI